MRMQGPPQGLPQTALQAPKPASKEAQQEDPQAGARSREWRCRGGEGPGYWQDGGVSQKQKAEHQVIDHTRAFVPPAPLLLPSPLS